MWLLKHKATCPLWPTLSLHCCPSDRNIFSSFSVSHWLHNEFPNHGKARFPPKTPRSFLASSPNNPSSHPWFQSCWTTAIANMPDWFIQLLLFSFWGILIHQLKCFTWVGSSQASISNQTRLTPFVLLFIYLTSNSCEIYELVDITSFFMELWIIERRDHILFIFLASVFIHVPGIH